jgi:hypothetical protein
VAVNPDSDLARVAREEEWEVLRFDRLSRRLKTLAGLAGAAVAGAAGTMALAARERRRRSPLRVVGVRRGMRRRVPVRL